MIYYTWRMQIKESAGIFKKKYEPLAIVHEKCALFAKGDKSVCSALCE